MMRYRYHGQLGFDKVIHENYFLDKVDGLFIEAGAFDGVLDSNTLFFYLNKNWRGINVEPLPNIFDHLNRNRPEDVNLNVALSDHDGSGIFTQAIDKNFSLYGGHFGNGSLKHQPEHLQELRNRGCSLETYKVQMIDLVTLFNLHISAQPDLFILDIEGHEMTVLTRLKQVSNHLHPKVFGIEKGHSGREKIIEIMMENDYSLDYEDSINLLFLKDGCRL